MKRSDIRSSPADIITAAIIARLELGVRPWVRPWSTGGGGRPLRANGTPYRGINTFWLWMAAENAGFGARTWMTYRQAQALGAQVREGERAQFAVFYKSYTKKGDPVGPEPSADEQRRVMRSYAVFNADQIDGLPEQFYPERLTLVPPTNMLPERATAFVERLPARVRHGGAQAYYDRASDYIAMPPVSLFRSRASWAATLSHEAGHWTGHPDRLDRTFGKRFGDRAYAFEELCAEMCAGLLGADLGLPVEHLDDHAAYIGHWLAILREDNRALLTAAARAEAACGYLLRATGLATDDVGEAGEAAMAEAA